jgi:peptidoglycan hydrolase-like amidase
MEKKAGSLSHNPKKRSKAVGNPAAESEITIPRTIRVLLPDDSVVEMDLDKYLKGVVPAEMGTNRPLEALKAQAVAARCYNEPGFYAIISAQYPPEYQPLVHTTALIDHYGERMSQAEVDAWRQTSKPFRPGMSTSSRTKSGFRAKAFSSASSP